MDIKYIYTHTQNKLLYIKKIRYSDATYSTGNIANILE